jgi:hypothetical protein
MAVLAKGGGEGWNQIKESKKVCPSYLSLFHRNTSCISCFATSFIEITYVRYLILLDDLNFFDLFMF